MDSYTVEKLLPRLLAALAGKKNHCLGIIVTWNLEAKAVLEDMSPIIPEQFKMGGHVFNITKDRCMLFYDDKELGQQAWLSGLRFWQCLEGRCGAHCECRMQIW